MKGVTLAFLAVLVVVTLLAAAPGEAITCSEIQSTVMPCAEYLTGGGEPSESCCSGIKALANSLQSQGDRQAACNCMKSAANSYGIQPDAASNLPGKCGVSVGVAIGPDTDCSQVS